MTDRTDHPHPHGIDPKDIVRRGYDAISDAYRDDRGDSSPGYATFLDQLAPLLNPGARVLDLGCGCGVPATRSLAQRYRVTGIDISPVQIERARRLVPNAELAVGDMTEIDFPADGFDAIVSFYAIIHVPLEEQPALLGKICRWLRPGGHLLAILGRQAWTGTEENWHGAPMYWSHADEETYRGWLEGADFRVRRETFVAEGDGGHTLFLAQRPA